MRERTTILRFKAARDRLLRLRQYLKDTIFPSKIEGKVAFYEVREQEKQVKTIRSRVAMALFRKSVRQTREEESRVQTTHTTPCPRQDK